MKWKYLVPLIASFLIIFSSMSFIGAVDNSSRLIYSVITFVFGIIILGGSILIYGRDKEKYGYMITTIFSVLVFLIAYVFLGEDSPPAFIYLFLGSIIGIIGGALKLKTS